MKTSKFKMTEIGEIPADWDTSTIASFATVETGNRNTQDKCASGLYPFYVRSPIVERIDDYGYDTEGVITVGDGVGTGKVFHYVNGKFALHQRCYLISNFREDIWPRYFYTIFSTRFFDRVMQMTAKSSVDSVRREMITGMEIPIPPLAEQKAIAEALSEVDALIAAQQELIEKKRAIKQGAMQELLTGKKRLPGFGGKCRQESLETEDFNAEAQRRRGSECKMTEVGLIPMDWEVKRLGKIGESIRGVGFRPEQTSHTLIPNSTMLLRANNIQNNQIACQDVVYVMNECIADYQQLIEGDVLICSANGSRNLVGKAAIWSKESSATFGAFMAVFRCAKGVDSCFVGYLFQSKRYRMQLDDILTGSAINNLNAKDIDELKFAFPSLAEQKAIAEVLSDMDAEISELKAQKAKFESIKQGLMQELLTGKIRLEV